MPPTENHLIAALPRKDRGHLLAVCESILLAHDQLLCEAGRPTRHAYFPISVVISLLVSVDDHPALQVGMLGNEGMLGAHLLSGQPDDPQTAQVAASGDSWRISATGLKRELATSVALRRAVGAHAQRMHRQLATNAGCLRFHQIGPRLARWLLTMQDHTQADRFHVTHEFLARMLGVRRVGITVAASTLQRAGLLDYHRGAVHILDRTGLQAACCSCYLQD